MNIGGSNVRPYQYLMVQVCSPKVQPVWQFRVQTWTIISYIMLIPYFEKRIYPHNYISGIGYRW